MDTYVRFLYEFLDQLFGGVVEAVKDFFLGILQMFDVRAYANLIKHYSTDFSGGEWFLVVVAIICTMLLLALFIFCIYFLVRKYIRFRKTLVEQESLLEELADLMEVIFAIMKDRNISIEDVENARQIKNSKKGSFNDKIYLIDVEQEDIDEREEKELKKEWRKNT